MRRRTGIFAALAPAAAGLILLSSCASVGYYGQALWGGARILAARRPVARLLQDPDTPADLKRRLQLALEIRDFATAELRLPDNGSYRSFARLDRRYAVWNVVAAPELSLSPVTWCFPVAGCVSYRGYFSEERAERFAAKLAARGFDVDVGGVTAYSTLGRLRDPLLSTFIEYPEVDLAGLVFHELAHQRVYARDGTDFNESFATAVELEGIRRWLEHRERPQAMREVVERMRREDEAAALILSYRERLAAVYGEPRPDSWKRQRKTEVVAELRAAYEALRSAGGGTRWYDAWFAREPNNARLASIGAYRRWLPAFRALLAEAGDDLELFYAEAERLATLPPAARRAELEKRGRGT